MIVHPSSAEALEYINRYILMYGFPPSRREIAEEFDVSPSTSQSLLKQLVEEGLLTMPSGSIPRGMRVTDAGRKLIHGGQA